MSNINKEITELENKIEELNVQIEINTKNSNGNICLFCNKIFYNHSNTERHIKTKCKKVKDLQNQREIYRQKLLNIL